MPDMRNITVNMSMLDFEYYKRAEEFCKKYEEMFKRANLNGTACLTSELKTVIEEIYLPESGL